MAILTFNKGASAMLSVMDRLWLETIVVTVSATVCKLQIVKADSVTSACAKHKRKSCDIDKKVKRHKQELKEGPTYKAGMAD